MAVLTPCHLCGRPARAPLAAAGRPFCCAGCRDLFLVLGEERLAELRSHGDLDFAALRPEPAAPPAEAEGEVRTARLALDGLWCASCAVLVEHVLRRSPGVLGAKVDPAGATAEVAYDPAATAVPDLAAAVARLGYGAAEGPSPPGGAGGDLLRRLAAAWALALSVMMLSVPVWSGYLPAMARGPRLAFAAVLWALATPAVLWCGWPFVRGAWASVRSLRPTMDLLVALGSLSAYGYSVWAALRGGPRLYFDTSAMLVAFLLLGRALERGTRRRASDVTRLLGGLAAPDAAVRRGDAEVRLPSDRLAPGDVLVVRPGQALAADGIVRAGRSAVDASALTGEAVPADMGPGDRVYAGSVAIDGRLEVAVDRVGAATVLGQTAEALRAALQASGRWQRLADRAVAVFVPVVLAIGAATGAGWLAAGLPGGTALLRAVAVLVIACPCALGVATPLASLAAARRLARLGVLLRRGDALERASGIDTVLLDKTGTVTAGALRLEAMAPDDPELLALAAAAESGSAHPLALAVVFGAEARGLAVAAPESFREHPGAGVEASVGGRRVALRAARDLPPPLQATAAAMAETGATVLALEVDGVPRAVLSLGDRPRPGARAAVAALRARGLDVRLVTGDAEASAAAAAQEAGIASYRARCAPDAKAALVEELRAQGRRVAFVGDGINDAAALAAADLGLAMGGGADLALQAGALTLVRPDLGALPAVLDVARQTRAVIRQNLTWALLYNALAVPAAVLGYAQPVVAAAAMVFSSAVVLGNALRLLGRGPARLWVPAGAVAAAAAALWALAWWRL